MKSSKDSLNLPQITICGAEQLRALKHTGFTHIISIWGSRAPHVVTSRMKTLFPAAKLHITFFDDVIEGTEETGSPGLEHLQGILAFSSGLTPADSLLVQCLMGISRSSACAFAIACQHTGAGYEHEVLKRLLKRHPGIRPNPRIAQLADDLLGRNGKMVAVVDAHLKLMAAKR